MSKYSYNQEFLDLGFTSIKDHGAEKPQCLLCYKMLSNKSLKKNKLKRHLEMKHPQHVKKNRIFFQHRETELIRSRICSKTNPALLASKQATLASYVVSLHIGKEIKPHTIGERLVKPAAIDMARLIPATGPMRALQGLPVRYPYRFGHGRCSGPAWAYRTSFIISKLFMQIVSFLT